MEIAAFLLQEQPGKNCASPNVIICISQKQFSKHIIGGRVPSDNW